MSKVEISDSIRYIGCDDHTIDLFESQYKVPNGVSYNSYLIMDDKIAIMDTVDSRTTKEWVDKLESELSGRKPDYLIISHMEPDHSSNISLLGEKYPDLKFVGNTKTFQMLQQFFDMDISNRMVEVKEGDTLTLGKHILQFIMAPMIHWPEVMMEYEKTEKILFSADGFGKFGALDIDEEWDCEARRYYINIVGKYGASVRAILKKASNLDIQMIAPLHGPILKENLAHYIEKYDAWSSYRPEDEGVVIAFASIHGNTKVAAKKMAEILKAKGHTISIFDLSRDDMSEAVADAFRYDKLIIASPTYDAALFPCMEDFLYHLKIKNYQNRKVGIIENGTWAPVAGKLMKTYIEELKNCEIAEPMVTIKSTMNPENIEMMKKLAEAMFA